MVCRRFSCKLRACPLPNKSDCRGLYRRCPSNGLGKAKREVAPHRGVLLFRLICRMDYSCLNVSLDCPVVDRGLSQPFPAPVKTITTEDAPLSAVFGGRGFRPLKPYDFVAALDIAVSAGDSITAGSAKAVQSSTNHNLCSRNPGPSNPAKTGGSLS